MFWGSVVVAACALGFTIGSFWWLNARRGKLIGFAPRTFAAALPHDHTLIRLPVLLYNRGARPIVVTNMRLVLQVSEEPGLVLRWNVVRDQLMPEPDDKPQFASGFAVGGRATEKVFAEFRMEGTAGRPEALDYAMSPGNFITYSNVAEDVADEVRAEARCAFDLLD